MPIEEHRLLSLLGRLEDHWVRQGAAVASAVLPGLTDGEIDALIEPLGIRLPDELRTWWRWHNGSEPPEDIGPGRWQHQSLSLALEYYHQWARIQSEPFEPNVPALAEAYWHQSWFPITTLGGSTVTLYVDTAGIGPGDPAPVRILDSRIWQDFLDERAPSFTDAVQLWVDALDHGYYWWSTDYDGWWDDRGAEIPWEPRRTGLL